MSDADNKKSTSPPSEMSPDVAEEEVGYKAIMIRIKNDFSEYDIIEDFEFDGVKYTAQVGLARHLISMAHKEQEVSDVIKAVIPEVVESLMNKEMVIDIPGQGRASMPFVTYLANHIGDVFIQKNEQFQKSKSKIIKPI